MRRLLSRISGRVGWAFTGLSGRLYRLPAPAPTPQEAMVALWFEHQGDKTLRVDYDLGEGSLVFDLGGYEGQWASDIFSRYCCTVHVFEPVEGYAEKIERRFAKNRKIVVHRHGLASENEMMKINIEGGEYDLLEHLIDSGFVKNIKDIQVQFHDFVPDAEPRMSRIQRELEK